MTSNPPEQPGQADRVAVVPLGHSRAAHRAHGWCSHCKGHGPAEEIVAWRNRENERAQAQERAEAGPGIHAQAGDPTTCPACGDMSLTVVQVRVLTDAGPRVAGGWAYCTACDATPYAVMEVPGA